MPAPRRGGSAGRSRISAEAAAVVPDRADLVWGPAEAGRRRRKPSPSPPTLRPGRAPIGGEGGPRPVRQDRRHHPHRRRRDLGQAVPSTTNTGAGFPPRISRSLFPTLWYVPRRAAEHGASRESGTILNVSSVAATPRPPPGAVRRGEGRRQRDHPRRWRSRPRRTGSGWWRRRPAAPRRRPAGSRAGRRRESEQEHDWYQTIVDQTVDSSLMKRYGTLDEQASGDHYFLASDEASYVAEDGASGRRWCAWVSDAPRAGAARSAELGAWPRDARRAGRA